MLLDFFYTLRKHKLKTSITEWLDLMNAMSADMAHADIEGFYFLARTVLVKDESQYDRFDKAFAEYFKGVQAVNLFDKDIPEEWLRSEMEKLLSDEEKAKIEAMGGLDKLMETLQERLKEQEKRHQGGNKWIGTGGTSPFGADGYNPEGVRIGQKGNRNFSAVKVWDKREFKNLSNDVEIGTRNIKIALRRLRKFARTGAADELDVNDTISSTAKNAGYLDLKMAPERRNAIKLLLFFDIGGSMDAHIKRCEELFSAAHSEFKHIEFFYFHNCVYEGVWKDNMRRGSDIIDTHQIIHKYGSDYKVIFVGDATMGPYEITYPGGSVEHWNEEPGSAWMERLLNHFEYAVWLNPQPEAYWSYHASLQIMKEIMRDRMYPLTVEGLTDGIKTLLKRK
ncbi:VWA domain-containing protein [Glaciecola sp. KUL10]|uniref:vWA domain-containing protein n=1 Tax=Glaciecola sp. (strain KUL10) TaxID=2161813 RepID=UPI000D78B789|nr:VWA domain-containing protein [Glaciecola sp. KUL10]GBL02830.1 VWA containing CoxE family protein [Glaciecola sp. KUL10]